MRMKKKILLFVLLLMPLMVNALDVCDVASDNQTSNNRTLTCSPTQISTTKFKSTKEKEVLKNDVCTITCTEDIAFSIKPTQKVLAGMSFSYPLYSSGVRKCTAKYNYKNYEDRMQKLVDEYKTLTDTTAKNNKAKELDALYEQKARCDGYAEAGNEYESKYSFNGEANLKVETSTNVENVTYEYKDIDEYYTNVVKDNINYYSCGYNSSTKNCDGAQKTINGWTSTSRVYGKYTMKEVFIEKYTGEIKTTKGDNTCEGMDRFFVDLNEYTRPVSNDKDDNGYSLTLTATNLNTKTINDTDWNLTVNCYYQVNNLMFPQGGTNVKADENYSKYGNTAFQYRIVALEEPFPDREAGANWKGNESIITSSKSIVFSTNNTLERFIINLDRAGIRKVREYNELYKYDTFNLDSKEQSIFINNMGKMFDRKGN